MLTPLEIHNKEFKKSFRGYDEDEVDEFLDMVIADYEQIYKENIDLREILTKSEGNVDRYKDLEDTLKNALVVAQHTSDSLKVNAEKEARLIIQEANAKVEQMVADSQNKLEKMVEEYERLKNRFNMFKVKLRSFMEMQMAMIEGYEEVNTGITDDVNLQFSDSEFLHIHDEIKDEIPVELPEELQEEFIVEDISLTENSSDILFEQPINQVVDEDQLKKLNVYDLPQNEYMTAKQNTIIFTKEEIAAAIEEDKNDKTIF